MRFSLLVVDPSDSSFDSLESLDYKIAKKLAIDSINADSLDEILKELISAINYERVSPDTLILVVVDNNSNQIIIK